MGILTLDGMRKLRPCYLITQIDVYLEDGTDPGKVISHLHQNFGFSQDLGKGKYAKATEKAQAQIEKLLKDYGVSSVDYAVMYQGKIILSGNSSSYQIKEMTNMKEFLSGQLGLYGSMLKGIITVILMVTFLIIGAILSNTIKTLIKKKKEELGIYKALGFTTKDLVKILALNFTFLAGISAAAGTLLCMTTAPSLLQLLFENAGLSILLLASMENEDAALQEYTYSSDGTFHSTKGNYITSSGTLSYPAGGIAGSTEFGFQKESNGKTYLMGTIRQHFPGMGDSVITMPLVEKVEEISLPDSVQQTWEKRNGKEYYLIEEAFCSNEYLDAPILKVELLSSFPSYTSSTNVLKNCRIVDENHAVCQLDLPVMIGRDLKNYEFSIKNGIEYLSTGDLTLLSQDGLLPSSSLKDTISLAESPGSTFTINR